MVSTAPKSTDKLVDTESTVRLTVAQATVRFLANQYVERDGQRHKFFAGCLGISGQGHIFFINLLSVSANTAFRTVTLENLVSIRNIVLSAPSLPPAARTPGVRALPHESFTGLD